MKFYLVSPASPAGESPGVFYWMKDSGQSWIHFVKGVWKEKRAEDIIKEVVHAQDPFELDWSMTPLHNQDSLSGWLSRCGRFYGCPPNYHDKLACYVLGMKVPELESTGWVRVNDSRYYTCQKGLSAEQRNWLSGRGYRLYEG